MQLVPCAQSPGVARAQLRMRSHPVHGAPINTTRYGYLVRNVIGDTVSLSEASHGSLGVAVGSATLPLFPFPQACLSAP